MLRTVALTALLAGVLAAPASAATLVKDEGRLYVTAAPGETNQLVIRPLDTGPLIVNDPGATFTGCTTWGGGQPDDRFCDAVGSPVVALGDGDDSAAIWDAGTEIPIGVTEVDGGPGNDTVVTAQSSDVLTGGEGDDDLDGGDLGADVIDGGAGKDKLKGQWGDDTITGGADADRIIAGPGADTIHARDGERDAVDCGEDEDTVTADAADALTNCEHVALPATPQAPGGGDTAGPGGTPSGAGGNPGGAAGAGVTPTPAPRSTTPATDRTAPKLRIRAKGRVLTLRADEACTVTVRAGGRRLTRHLKAGAAIRVRVPGRARAVRLSARDAAGNVATASRRLARARGSA